MNKQDFIKGVIDLSKKRRKKQQSNLISIDSRRKLSNINIGVIIFAVMFVYIMICVILYFTKGHVNRYEVKKGSLSLSNVYTGLILRDEDIVSSNSSGYINYFAHEGEHAACGDLVYSLDQTGHMADILQDSSEVDILSANDLKELRNDFIDFTHYYSDATFNQTYNFSYDTLGNVLKLTNYNMLNNLRSSDYRGSVDFYYSPRSGAIVYNVDGYENKTPERITLDDVNKSSAETKTQLTDNTLIGMNDPVYKIIHSEKWSIIIPVENARVPQLEDEGYIEVKFLKNQNISWAKVNPLQRGEEYTLVELQLNNSMITFAKDRYIDIEVILENENGLKIPNSSIVEKEFYLIPKEYAAVDEKGNIEYFMRESHDENGAVTIEQLQIPVYSETETDYYVDTYSLSPGDNICKPDSQDKFPISKIGTLIGVYNINKGFADFKEITILYSNDEYSIVKSNTNYGLVEYDYIVLDADNINEDDFINE